MFFNSFIFVGFLISVLIILFAEKMISKSVNLRNVTLLIASYLFYGYFNIGFTFILAFVTLVNWIGGRVLLNNNTVHKKRVIACCVVLSLIPLVFFKYSLWLYKSISDVLSLDIKIELLDGLILPVGISFFTFQALSYTIDVYRGKINQPASALDFFLFVSFFPTIMSGPIEKARNLLPQIRRYFYPTVDNIAQGLCIFLWGLFKKMVIADRLAYYVDWVYGTTQYQSGTTLALAAIFYSIQIYCDFSGYSDMALGVAKTLGFDVTKNFRQPYFSRTFKEFWRKWHIALTSWFTEYVYFSLGGSRVKNKMRWVLNISTIFLLSGIWHGAAWSFIIWGTLHAIYYLIEHFLGLQSNNVKWNKLTNFLSGIIVFALVTIAWIFFRLDFADATTVVGRIFTVGGRLSMGASSFTFASTILMLVIFIIYELMIWKKIVWFDVEDYTDNLTANILAIIPLVLLMGMFGMSSDNFVYFQF